MDLAHAHTLALQYLLENKKEEKCTVFNLGIGKGVSVLEALSAFEQETKVKAPFILGERRPGDVVEIYADFHKAAEKLGWEPKRSIGDIMRTAWEWEKVKNQ
jgi:UDP-glucose 4-epimerase